MVTVIFVLIVIWQIVKMMNKAKADQAKRDENRKRQIAMNAKAQELSATPVPSSGFMQENDTYDDTSDRWDDSREQGSYLQENSPDRLIDPATDAPEYVSRLLSRSSAARRKQPAPLLRDDYAIQASPVRRVIRLDKESLRTFVLTREVLAPPRSRSRYRPGTRK